MRHRLIDILVIAWAAVLRDADGWDDIEDFVKAKAAWFATFLDLGHGVASADIFRRVISRLRRMTINRLKAADHLTKCTSIKGSRKIAGWDHQFLLNLVAG